MRPTRKNYTDFHNEVNADFGETIKNLFTYCLYTNLKHRTHLADAPKNNRKFLFLIEK